MALGFTGKHSGDGRAAILRHMPSPCMMLFTCALIAMSTPLLLGRIQLCDLHRQTLRFPDMPARRSCDDGVAAVDTDGNACISLANFTTRTSIHRASTKIATYMYCSLPKNGCSYHIDLLHRVNGDIFPGSEKHSPKNKVKIMITDEKEAATLISDNSIPKYMVIRNPMTRTLSAYLCKVEQFYPEIDRTPANFQKWCRESFTNPPKSWKKINEHWRPQTEFCGYNMRDIQKKFHVFRVEEPEGYVNFLYDIIPNKVLDTGWGAKNRESFRDFVLSPHKRTGHTEDKFLEYVGNLETFDLLERTFRKDIDTLGYREQITQMRKDLEDIIKSAETRTAERVVLK